MEEIQRMKVLITGTSNGIGLAAAKYFVEHGQEVYGFDIEPPKLIDDSFHHFTVDVRDVFTFPTFDFDFDIIINNAGIQSQNVHDCIETNLVGAMLITDCYGIKSKKLKSILNIASASAHTGAEFGGYSASKGGLLAYTKHIALKVADRGATCNSISPGGVLTDLNKPVMEDIDLWKQIMDLTPLKRWAEPEEMAEWCYFLTVKNKFMTGQDIMIDGGESTNAKFVWVD